MSLQIAQSATYVGEDWWKWSVWIDGTPDELNKVVSVEWILHPTFPTPIREVTNRRTKFKLSTGGWGEFTVRARVMRKTGAKLPLSHTLQLPYPTTPGLEKKFAPLKDARPAVLASSRRKRPREKSLNESPRKDAPRVFLSYASSDAKVAQLLKQSLAKHGIATTDGSDVLDPGLPIHASVSELIKKSMAMVTVQSDTDSMWRVEEERIAKSLGVPVIPFKVKESIHPDQMDSLWAQVDEALGKYLPE